MSAKTYFFITIPLTVIGVILRFLELIYGVDPSTGYYVNGNYLYLVFNVFALITVLFFTSAIITLRKSKVVSKKTVVALCSKTSSPAGILFGVSAAALLVSVIFKLIDSNSDLRTLFRSARTLKDIVASFDFWICILSLLCVVYFISFMTSSLNSVNSSGLNVLSLTVPVYFCLRMFQIFSRTSSILSRAYDGFSILSFGFFILFFMNFSKMTIGVKAKPYIVSFGCSAFFFGFVKLAELVLYAFNNSKYNISLNPLEVASDIIIALLVFVIVYKISTSFDKNNV